MIPLRALAVLSVIVTFSGFASASTPAFRERERQYDVIHYALDIRLDENAGRVSGRVMMRLCPLKPLSTLTVDAVRMTINSVSLNTHGRKAMPVKFTTEPEDLVVTFPTVVNPADTIALDIDYSCTPKAGLYFVRPDRAYPDLPTQVWSQGEMEENRDWFPCYDYPNDRATVEMRVTVNDKFVAISNGALIEVTENAKEKTKTFSWYCAKPVVSYLISVVAGDYAEIKDHYKAIPLTYNVYPSQRADALRSFGKTPEMMKFFSEKTGFDYPWPKYSQTVVAEFTYGGMENVSATTLTDRTIHSERTHIDASSEGLVAHELAHQWFGDLLTCRNWSHAWLNEGFASYFQALYDEASHGWDEFQHEMAGEQAGVVLMDVGVERRPTVTDRYAEPVDVFDGHIYGRGSCILHMLRLVLGDEMFWRGIRHYVDLNQYQCVTTDEFQHAMEDVADQDLRWFFDEWVVRAGYPAFNVSAAFDSASSQIHLELHQTQQVDSLTPFYRMPVIVEVSTGSGSVQHRIWIEPQEHQQIDLSSRQRPLNIVFDKGHWLLEQLHFWKPIEMWMYQLVHGDAADRIDALEGLALAIDQDTVCAAIENAVRNDPFWGVRQKAAEVLGRTRRSDALRLLAPAFNDPEAKVRVAATTSLRNFKTLDALVALGNLFAHDSSDAVVAEAVGSLVVIDSVHATEYCEKGLSRDSHNDVVRAAAVRALGTLKTASAKHRLVGWTAYGQPPDVRLAAIDALAQNWQSDQEVRSLLDELVNDRKHHVQRRAIERLGSIGDESALNVLHAVIEHERNPLLRREARRAIVLIERRAHPHGG
jgi:aminopeptidase N